MPYFKDPDNSIHFLSLEDIANGGMSLLPSGCDDVTDDEVASIRATEQAAADSALPIVAPQTTERKLAAFLAENPDVLRLVQASA